MGKQHRHRPAYQNAKQDLAFVIAQETSGCIGALPEEDDYDLADEFIKRINERYDS